VNIPRSFPMEEVHTPTIIHVILLTDHVLIQLKVHMKFFVFQQSLTMNGDSRNWHTMKPTL